jgi:hypothetical protein
VPAPVALGAAAGYEHVLVVRTDGTVWGWGSNANEQLHPTLDLFIKAPVKIEGMSDIVSVAAGFGSSAAIDKDGAIYTWGNKEGVQKISVPDGAAVKAVASNEAFIALSADGIVYQWTFGENPVKVNLPRVMDIAAGANHYVALSVTGRVYCWGENSFGQLGDGTTNDNNEPKSLSGVYEVVSIGSGSNHAFAITKTGEIYGWGNNKEGQVGVGHLNDIIRRPEKLSIPDKIKAAAGGDRHSVALTTDGRLYSWGNAEYGQLANGTVEPNSSPKVASKDKTFDAIAAGANYTIGIRGNGIMISGRNNNGQIGNGSTENLLSFGNEVSRVKTSYAYKIDVLKGISAWARSDVQRLYDSGITPLGILWGFKSNITRAEFAALLVSCYETKIGEIKDAENSSFTDIAGSPYEKDIIKANKIGLVSGKSETRFDGDAAVTREEAAKMLSETYARIRGNTFPETVNVAVPYADARQIASWAMPYVAYAYDKKFLQGTTTGFLPKGGMTREAAMVAVQRM